MQNYLNKYYFIISIVLCLSLNIGIAGNPYKYQQKKKEGKENIFENGWPLSFSPDITFYSNQVVNGYGLSFEPSITENFSLNYRFSVNTDKDGLFSLHGNPGLVVSPFFFGVALSADSNKAGPIFLAIVSLLIPEGVNFKYIPDGYDKMAFAAYLNPIGVDYARKNPEDDKRLFMSGEAGIKAYFALNDIFYICAFGGIRSVYLFEKIGFTAGLHIGIVIPRD